MKRATVNITGSLFATVDPERTVESLGPGAWLLRAFMRGTEAALLREVAQIAAVAAFRQMTTPGGLRMSVAMTNCGAVGWISDRGGYRYQPLDPLSLRVWPAMPAPFQRVAALAAARAGYASFAPDVCLINRYEPGARLSLHRDQDEGDASAPIVSVSLGVAATFLWGGLRRTDTTRRIGLNSGDVVVWGGESRYAFHGVAPIAPGLHPLTGLQRINLTFRKART